MSDGNGQRPQSRAERDDLKRLVHEVVLRQGNRFIKELLREQKLRIGATKAEFADNLDAAVDSDNLRRQEVDAWLSRVEGWGKQSVYLYHVPDKLLAGFDSAQLRRKVNQIGLEKLWNAKPTLEYPDEAKLVSISFRGPVLTLAWHRAAGKWKRAPAMDLRGPKGLDEYWWKAHRWRDHRIVSRFELDPGLKLAAIFIADLMQETDHESLLGEMEEMVGRLLGLEALEDHLVEISNVARHLDQAHIPGAPGQLLPVKTHKSQLGADGSYVEFGAWSEEHAYWESNDVRQVRLSVGVKQLPRFSGSVGSFEFLACDATGLTRNLRVLLSGTKKRIQLRAQMEVTEVWTLLELLAAEEPKPLPIVMPPPLGGRKGPKAVRPAAARTGVAQQNLAAGSGDTAA